VVSPLGSQVSTTHGPVPIGCEKNSFSVFPAKSFGKTPLEKPVSSERNGVSAFFSVMVSVASSVAVMALMGAASGSGPCTLMCRSRENFASAAVTGVPSENCRPLRSVNV